MTADVLINQGDSLSMDLSSHILNIYCIKYLKSERTWSINYRIQNLSSYFRIILPLILNQRAEQLPNTNPDIIPIIIWGVTQHQDPLIESYSQAPCAVCRETRSICKQSSFTGRWQPPSWNLVSCQPRQHIWESQAHMMHRYAI